MKRFKKIFILVLILLITLELGLLGSGAYIYVKDGVCPININGRIISAVDNQINFSGFQGK